MVKQRYNKLKGGDPSQNNTSPVSFSASPGKRGREFIENPHTTMALLICIIGFVVTWAIFFSFGEDKSFFLYEISMSAMSMVGAAAGVSYFLLQGEENNEWVNGFPVLAILSLASWSYFAYNASGSAGGDTTKDDTDDKDD